MLVPTTRFAQSGEVNIAYQVVGEGEFDVVFTPGAISHVDLIWDDPPKARFFEKLSSYCRLIVFDKRGTGASDPAEVGDLETRIDDVRAVMDAVGSRRAALVGVSEGGPMSLLFAATHPGRVAALALYASLPRFTWAPDFPWGRSEEAYQGEMNEALRVYADRDDARKVVRGLGMRGEEEIEAYIDLLRYGASPGMLEALYRMNREIDIREVLPTVRVPALVMHGSEDQVLPVEVGRYTAQQLRARFVELAGVGHLALGDTRADRIQVEIERFLREVWETGGWDEAEPERMLATVLFTDIVDSTMKAI